MFSTASAWARGPQTWRVTHDQALRHLDVSGDTPTHLRAIIERRTAEQDAEREGEVDFFFAIR